MKNMSELRHLNLRTPPPPCSGVVNSPLVLQLRSYLTVKVRSDGADLVEQLDVDDTHEHTSDDRCHCLGRHCYLSLNPSRAGPDDRLIIARVMCVICCQRCVCSKLQHTPTHASKLRLCTLSRPSVAAAVIMMMMMMMMMMMTAEDVLLSESDAMKSRRLDAR